MADNSQNSKAGRALAPRSVVIVALVTAICLLGDSALYVLLPSQLELFSVTPTGAGLILGINRYIRILSNHWASKVYERLGFYRPFAFSVLLAALTTSAYGLFVGFWALFLAHAAWGIAWSILRLGGYLAVIDAAQGQSTGRLMGMLQSLSRGGSLCAVLAGGILADHIGGRQVFVIYGVMTLTAFGLIPFASVRGDLGVPEVKSRSENSTKDEVRSPGRIRVLYFEASVVWLVVAGIFVATAGYFVRTIAGDGTMVLGFVIGIGTLSGLLVAIRWLGDLCLGPVFGHLSDRLGKETVIVTSLGIAAVSMIGVALWPTLAMAIPAFTCVFFASTALIVSLNASIADLAPANRRTSILSRYATWADIGSGTGPIVALPMVATLGFGWTYGAGAAVTLAALGIYLAVFMRKEST